MRGNNESASLDFLGCRDASSEVVPPGGCPNFHSTWQRLQVLARNIRLHTNRAGTLLRLGIANDAAPQHSAIPIQNPDGIGSLREWLHVVGAGMG